jgi:hypothetical protein
VLALGVEGAEVGLGGQPLAGCLGALGVELEAEVDSAVVAG